MSDNLPQGWEKKWNAQYRRFYYVDHNTKHTQWTVPQPLKQADRWEKKWSPQYSRWYYINHTTKQTQWQAPDDFAADADSDASDSSEEEIVSYFTQEQFKTHLRQLFNAEIKSKLKIPQSFDSFFDDACKNYPKLIQIKQQVNTSAFDKDEMLPLVDSMMHAHMEAANRQHEQIVAKAQIQAITEIYQSFTSLETSLDVVAKKGIANEWKQLKNNRSLPSGSYNRVKQKFKEACQEQLNIQNASRERELEECNNQKRELDNLLNNNGISLSMKVLSARKGFQAEYRQLYSQNQKLDYLDMNIVKKGIAQYVLEEREKKENEKKQAEQSKKDNSNRAKDEKLRAHQEQVIVKLVDELIKINPGLMNELYNKAKFQISGDSIGDIVTYVKKRSFGFNKFSIIKVSLESKLEAEIKEKADAEVAVKQAKLAEKQAKLQEKKDRMKAKRDQTKKEKLVNERKENERAPKITLDKNPEWETKEHINYGHVQRCMAKGGSESTVNRVIPRGSISAVGSKGPGVQRIVPKGAVEPRRERLVQKGARLAGQFEKVQAVGPQIVTIHS